MKDKRAGKRNYRDLPKPIPDTPENVAKAILGMPPKAKSEWRYLQDTGVAEDRSDEERE